MPKVTKPVADEVTKTPVEETPKDMKVESTEPEVQKAGLIYERMAKIMLDCPEIGKDMTNSSQNFKFRGIDQFYNALHTLMAKNKVFSTSKIVEMTEREYETKKLDYKTKKEITQRMYSVSGIVGYTFWTTDGSSVYTEVMTKGMDYGDKETNKAMSIAHKYALIQIFAIPTNEPDPDSESPEVITGVEDKNIPVRDTAKPTYTKKPVAPAKTPAKEEAPVYASERDKLTITGMLSKKVADPTAWLSEYGIKSLDTLPAVRAKKMIDFLITMPSQLSQAEQVDKAVEEEVKEETPAEAPVETAKTPEKKRTREEILKELEDMGEEVPNVGEGK